MAKLLSDAEVFGSAKPAGNLLSDADVFGTAEPQGGFIPAAKQAIGAGIKGLGQAAADFVPGVSQGNGLSSYGQSVIDANPTKIHSLSDIADSPWQTVKEATGNALGSMGPMLGARAAGMGITAAAPFTGPAAPIVAGVGQLIANAGPIVAAAAPSFGGIREQQIASDPNNEADAKSKAIALLGAGTVGLIESKFGPQEWALAAMKKGGLEELANRLVPAGASIPAAIGKGFARGAAVEGAEELVQNPIEQLAGYQDPTTKANVLDTLHGGAMGAIGGGVLGGGMAGTARAVSGPISKASETANASGATRKAEFDKAMQAHQANEEAQAKATKQGPKNEQNNQAGANEATETKQGPFAVSQESGGGAGAAQDEGRTGPAPSAVGQVSGADTGATSQDIAQGLGQDQIVQPGATTPAVEPSMAQPIQGAIQPDANQTQETIAPAAGQSPTDNALGANGRNDGVQGNGRAAAAVPSTAQGSTNTGRVGSDVAASLAQNFGTPAQPTTGGILPQQSTALDVPKVANASRKTLQHAPDSFTTSQAEEAAALPLPASGRNVHPVVDDAQPAKVVRSLPPSGESLPPSPVTDIVRVRTVYGDYVNVRQKDIDGSRPTMRTYHANGRPIAKDGSSIHRDNLDPTGEKQKARNAEFTPDIIAADMDRKAFATEAAAKREASRRGVSDTHEPIPASEVSPGTSGFVLRAKKPVVKDSLTTAPANESQAPEPKAAATVKESLTVAPTTSEGSRKTAVEVQQNSAIADDPIHAYPQTKAESLAKMLTRQGAPSEIYPYPPGSDTFAIRIAGTGDKAESAQQDTPKPAKPTMAERRAAAEATRKAKAADDARKVADSAPKVEEKPLWKRTVADAVGPQVIIPEVDKYPRLEKIARDNPEKLTDADKALLDKKKKQVSARAKALREHKPYLERANSHYAAVKEAIERGEAIPDEVKADYPHLFKDEQKPVQPAKAEKPAQPAKPEPSAKPEADDTRFNVESAPFYSALSREIAAANIKAGPALSWKGVIRGLINSGKVKADEVEWSGLNEWLDLQQGKITKDQVSAFVDANGVQVQDVTLGRTEPVLEPDVSPGEITVSDANEHQWKLSTPDGRSVLVGKGTIDFGGSAQNYGARYFNGQARERNRDKLSVADTSKYSQYQLPGGENYREVLLTLPGKSSGKYWAEDAGTVPGHQNWMVASKRESDGETLYHGRSHATREAAELAIAEIDGTNLYHSNHWDQSNVLAHIRVNDRTDADGKRVLFVEELQSDWGQKGKKDGFKGTPEGAKRFFGIDDAAWSKMDNEDRQSYIAEMDSKRGAVPAAPFVTNTDKWLALALKRIIKMAADGGYDRVAFINGEQSAERYDLSKRVEALAYVKNPDGTYEVTAYTDPGNGGMLTSHPVGDKITDDKLEDYVGKEIAKKIANNEGEASRLEGWRTLRGVDLKAGGEGMRAFYDKIVPAAVKSVTKKLGGGQLGEVSIDGTKQQGFDITPIMRERAAGGMPLFNRNGQMKISPADSAVYEMARDGKSAAEILEFLGKASRNGFNRYLANALKNMGVSSTVKLDSMGGWNFNRSKQGPKYAAAYSPKTDTIALFTPREAERHILHEFVHGVTLKAITAGGRPALEMKRLYEHVKASGALDGMYGMTNLDEFVAEAFSNPEFQRALMKVAAPRAYTVKTAWDAFVRFVAKLVGLRSPALQSALDKAMVLGAELMRENAKLSGKGGDTRFSLARKIGDTTIIENPTRQQARVMLAKSDYKELRGLQIPETGKLFIWDANKLLHEQAATELGFSADEFQQLMRKTDGHGKGLLNIKDLGEGAYPYPIFSGERKDGIRFSQESDTINVDGTERPRTNSNGKPIAGTDEALRKFWRWFSGSVVVDESGAPLVMYHGAKEKFTKFDASFADPTMRGIGFHVTSNKARAALFSGGNSPMEIYVRVSRPFAADRGYQSALEKEHGRYGSESAVASMKKEGFDGLEFQAKGEKHFAPFDANQIKSADQNTGEFSPDNHDIRFNVESSDQWASSSADNNTLDDIIYKIANKQIDTRRTVQDITKKIGEIADEYNPELAETLYHGKAANETKTFLDFELRPLIRRMLALGVDTETLETYLWARHAEERNEQIAKINPRLPDGGSGLTNTQARQLLSGQDVTIDGKTIKGVPQDKLVEIGELASMSDAILKKSRELLVDSGLESKAEVDSWSSMYQHYAPLHREEFADDRMTGKGLGMSIKGPSGKRAIGSEKPVSNILASIVSQREMYITRAEKNKVGNATYGLATIAPNEDFWQAIDPMANASRDAQQLWAKIRKQSEILASKPDGDEAMEAIIDAMKAQHRALMKKAIPGMKKVKESLEALGLPAEMADRILAEPKELTINKRTGMVVERVNPLLRHLDNVLATRINGRDVFVVFNARNKRSARMAMAMKNLDADNLGFLLGNMAKATRYFAAINTQFNPIFGVTNFTRDVQTAMLNLSSTPLAGHKAEIAKRSISAMHGIYRDLRDHRAGKAPSSKWAETFEQFKKHGGATGYRDMFETLNDRAKDLQDELKKMGMGKARRMVTLGQSNPVFAWLSDYNEMMENSVRVAAFSVAIEQGMSPARAASLAKELTVNFNKKGQVAAQAGAMYAFFNAAVQGTSRIAQTLATLENGKPRLTPVGKKIIAGGVMVGVVQAILGALAGWDDEEPPQFVRERSLIIPVGDHYVSIPMPLGYNVLPNIGRITTEFALSGFKDPAKRISSMLNVLADTFNPIGNAGMSLQTITPTVIDPIAALSENKDWTGKPIKRMTFNEEAAGYKNAKDTATAWSKLIAEGLNYLTGGTEHKAGLMSPTPDQIDYLIGQVTGGVGREVSKIVQTGSSVISGEELPLYKVPLAGKFVGSTTGQAAESSRFYENLRELKAHKAEIDGRRKAQQDVAGYLRDNPDARLVPIATRIESRVQELRRAKRALLEKNAPKDHIKAIDERITAMMGVLNKRVDAIQRSSK